MANTHMKRETHTKTVSYTFLLLTSRTAYKSEFPRTALAVPPKFLVSLSWALNLGEPRVLSLVLLSVLSTAISLKLQILSLSLWITAFLSAYSSGYFKIKKKKKPTTIHCFKNLSFLCIWWRKRFQGFVCMYICMYAYVHTWHYFYRCKHIHLWLNAWNSTESDPLRCYQCLYMDCRIIIKQI